MLCRTTAAWQICLQTTLCRRIETLRLMSPIHGFDRWASASCTFPACARSMRMHACVRYKTYMYKSCVNVARRAWPRHASLSALPSDCHPMTGETCSPLKRKGSSIGLRRRRLIEGRRRSCWRSCGSCRWSRSCRAWLHGGRVASPELHSVLQVDGSVHNSPGGIFERIRGVPGNAPRYVHHCHHA